MSKYFARRAISTILTALELPASFARAFPNKVLPQRGGPDNKIPLFVFDFEDTMFMDSSGIGMIIGRYKIIQALGGKTMMIRPQPQVDKLLDLTGLKKIVECS